MTTDRVPAGYCPDCEHLLSNDDVVRIVGRHMDGLDPTFRCPACDADLAHPSRAPDDAPFYGTRSDRPRGSPGSTAPGDGRDAGGRADPGDGGSVVADQRPPLRLEGIREGDRITVHFDRPGMAARQTKAGTVTEVRRSPGGGPSLVRFATDTRRQCSVDVGPDATVTEGGDRLGAVHRVLVTRTG